jgi:hypothetical protein
MKMAYAPSTKQHLRCQHTQHSSMCYIAAERQQRETYEL